MVLLMTSIIRLRMSHFGDPFHAILHLFNIYNRLNLVTYVGDGHIALTHRIQLTDIAVKTTTSPAADDIFGAIVSVANKCRLRIEEIVKRRRSVDQDRPSAFSDGVLSSSPVVAALGTVAGDKTDAKG